MRLAPISCVLICAAASLANSGEVVRERNVHIAAIFSKTGKVTPSDEVIDGRWNLKQANEKLDLKIPSEQIDQLMACTGTISCTKGNSRVNGSASVVLKQNIILTAKHIILDEFTKYSKLTCVFFSFAQRDKKIPILLEKIEPYYFMQQDYLALRLKAPVKTCKPLAIEKFSPKPMKAGDRVLSATSRQQDMLNDLSDTEPVVAKGSVVEVLEMDDVGFFAGGTRYGVEMDSSEGGSGGAIFEIDKQGQLVTKDGSLLQKAILAHNHAEMRDGDVYRRGENGNGTFLVGIDGPFLIDVMKQYYLPEK